MMKLAPTTVAAMILAIFASAGRTDDAEAKTVDQLRGSWKLTRLEVGGEDRTPEGKPHWRIDGKKISYGGELFATFQPGGGEPKSIDLTLAGETETAEGIYSLEGDTLKVCLNWRPGSLKERPQQFATKEKSSFRLLEFHRVKDPKEDDASLRGFVGLMLKSVENQIIVLGTIDGSPAKKAGLQTDDVVLEVNGMKATTLRETVDSIRSVKPGNEITLRVERKGEKKEIKVKVGILPMRLLLET